MEEGRRTLPLWLIALVKLRTDEAHIAQPTDRPRGAERRGKGHMMSMSMNTHFGSDSERRSGRERQELHFLLTSIISLREF